MRGMVLAKAGGRTRERDPNPEGERRADKARGEAQRGNGLWQGHRTARILSEFIRNPER